MKDKLILLTGFKERTAYLDKIRELTRDNDHPDGLTESDPSFPSNIVVFGMRRDPERIMMAANVVVTTTSMGNIYDAITAKKPLVCLAPDIITADNLRLLDELIARTPKADLARLADRVAIMLETAPERALNLTQIAAEYWGKGLDPNNTVFDIAGHQEIAGAAEELVHDILFSLQHADQMGRIIGDIPILQAKNLLEIIDLLRTGHTIGDIANYILAIAPSFQPTYSEAVPANPVIIELPD